MHTFEINAYAKINLGLDVTGRLPGGYHQVKMIMQSVDLYDTLTFCRTTQAEGIILTTDSPGLSVGSDNLISRAAAAMFQAFHIQEGVHIHLHKAIPIAAGMAGGSTDAAATLKGINALFDIHAPLSRLMELGVSIGADVPYCLSGGTALAEGIGEVLTPLAPLPDCTLLLARPDISVSTKYVYEHLDAIPSYRHPDIDGMMASIQAGDLDGVLARMGNVLEAVTIPTWPVIASIKEEMRHLGAGGCLMSGSGPTVFGVFGDRALAEAACGQLQQSGLAPWFCLTRPV